MACFATVQNGVSPSFFPLNVTPYREAARKHPSGITFDEQKLTQNIPRTLTNLQNPLAKPILDARSIFPSTDYRLLAVRQQTEVTSKRAVETRWVFSRQCAGTNNLHSRNYKLEQLFLVVCTSVYMCSRVYLCTPLLTSIYRFPGPLETACKRY